jgi:GMP synthase (glutamine-hydrolysing)
MATQEKIVILDFGSQVTQLIARKIRDIGVYSEILPFNTPIEKLKADNLKGLIFSGSPHSVYEDNSPKPSNEIYNLGVPILGICYGLQYIAYSHNGQVDKGAKREFGKATLIKTKEDLLLEGISENSQVWMSHGDSLTKSPEGFDVIGITENSPFCVIRNISKQIWGVQFHPEVHHSLDGKTILENFVRKICDCKSSWNSESFIDIELQRIKDLVGNDEVILGLSGGVDSTVAAVLIHKAIGNKLKCIHVDSGLMRLEESERLKKLFDDNFKMNIEVVNAEELFLSQLSGVAEPEQKRKIIGKLFIDVFNQEASKFNNAKWLAQGTLYPDVIESQSVRGPSSTIKTHHNVGGLPKDLKFHLLEPFRELFKDEVREVGRKLGIPEWFIARHPFPGPGLGIRVLGEVTKEKCEILRKADDIFITELIEAGIYNDIWQAFAALLPVRSVGVMGDERTYEFTCVIRAVTSVDGMTADWYRLPYDLMEKVSNRIINEVRGINRVVFDITSKPPGTIEWE